MKPITQHPFSPDLLTSKAYFWNCRTEAELSDYYTKLQRRTDNDFDALLAITQENRQLYSMVSTTIPTMDGWTTVPKACALAALVSTLRPATVVEIGVWAGRSLLPMALAMLQTKSGMVIGIDPYSSQESARNEIGDNEKWWAAQDHQAIKEKFKAFCKRFVVESVVRLIEKPSDDVNLTGQAIQLLHIDGSHTEQAVRDAERFGSLVPVGGVIVLDDIMWVGGSVLRAIDSLENMGFVEAYRNTVDNWNIMQRVK